MSAEIIRADARSLPLADESVDCIVTSPPYWGLRDYGYAEQIGLEQTFDEFLSELLDVFSECKRVLKPTGTMWVNMGDSYTGSGRGIGGTVAPSDKQARNRGSIKMKQSFRADRHEIPRVYPTLPNVGEKNLVGQPWRLAFALQAAGWYLRSDIIWHKSNPMPESVTDRPTKSHEYIFLLAKSVRYEYDAAAVREEPVASSKPSPEKYTVALKEASKRWYQRKNDPFEHGERKYKSGRNPSITHPCGRNLRTVWTLPTQAVFDAHFATFPEALVERCVKAGCPLSGTVLDPFAGSGTVPLVANRLGRHGIGVELNPNYIAVAMRRCRSDVIHHAGESQKQNLMFR